MKGYTPLMMAVLQEQRDCVRLLIDKGAKLDLQGKVCNQLTYLLTYFLLLHYYSISMFSIFSKYGMSALQLSINRKELYPSDVCNEALSISFRVSYLYFIHDCYYYYYHYFYDSILNANRIMYAIAWSPLKKISKG